ncbi:MAG: hypothetical protein D6734_01400, partial [Candidatus Schekmanbacteria bacterium]
FALLKKKKKKEAFLLLFFGTIFPLSWFIGNYLELGSILPLADINIKSGAFEDYNLIKKLLIYPYIFLKTLTPLAGIIAFIGFALSVLKKRNIMLSLFIISQIAFLTLTVIKGTNAFPKPRYCLFSGILLIPFMINLLYEIEKKKGFYLKNITAVSIIISVLGTYIYFYKKNNPPFFPKSPEFVEIASKWIKENTNAKDKIFIDSFGWWNSNIAVKAKINPYNLGRIYADPFPGIITGDKYFLKKENGLKRYLNEEMPNYILLQPGGILDEWSDKSFLNTLPRMSKEKYSIVYKNPDLVIIKVDRD